MTDIILSTQNGEPVASSRQIAESFGKEHKHVLDSIKNLVAENSAAKSMFYETTFENCGKQYPMYLMNRDGFTLLAMGFTGKAALEWKLKYIQAFNAMEKQLAQRPQLSRAELMAQALIAAHDELEHKDRQIPYWKLRGRFHSCGYRDQEVAKYIGIGRDTMSGRMQGHNPWTSAEITAMCELLDIRQDEIGELFFPSLEKGESA